MILSKDDPKAHLQEALELLIDSAELFRRYEQHHRDKVLPISIPNVSRSVIDENNKRTLEKADANNEIASRIEAFLKKGMDHG